MRAHQPQSARSPAAGPAAGPTAAAAPTTASAGPGNAELAGRLAEGGPAVGGAKDGAEGQADALAGQVMGWLARNAEAASVPTGPPPSNGVSAELAAAFDMVCGFDVRGVRVEQGAAAEGAAKELGAEAFSADRGVHLPRGASEHLIAHELAHVALGHADAGQPVRRKATAATDPGIGISGSLKFGDRGAMVQTLQNALVRLGYLTATDAATGPGIFGRRTQAAVMAFQTAKKLTPDGVVGPMTTAALAAALNGAKQNDPNTGGDRNPAALTGKPALKVGMEGVQVKTLQKRLNRYGSSLLVDGEFGPVTQRAVIAFQKANSVLADGIVGPGTAALLNGETAKSVSKTPKPDAGGEGPATPVDTKGIDVDDADPKGILKDGRINPTVKNLAVATVRTLQEKGLSPYIVDGFRSFEEQNGLYDKGRTKPGPKVTYVKGGGSWHNYGLALDIVFWNKAHTGPSWDGKLPWKTLGAAGKAAGFTRWMGDSGWDFAHFEHHPKWGNECYSLAPTYRESGLQAVWNKVI